MTALFDPYPASSAAVRDAARRGQSSAAELDAVGQSFSQQHQVAVNEAEGDLKGWLAGEVIQAPGAAQSAPPLNQPFEDSRVLQRAAVWAAAQMERFADAIDDYNENSTKPRSISRLNLAYADVAGTANAGQLVKILKDEKAALDAELDGCAGRIVDALGREPTDDEIRAAWRAGNLPTRAVGLWPDLKLDLSDLPRGHVDTTVDVASLRELTDQQLVDALNDPELNADIRQLILDNRPSAVQLLADQWELTADTEAEGFCRNGVIVGPDGRLYSVDIPQPNENDTVGAASGEGDQIPDDGSGSGWTTMTSRHGSIEYGDPVGLREQIAFVIGGVKTYGWQSIGPDQEQYVAMDDGMAYVNDGTQPDPEYQKPPDGQVNPYPGEHTYPEPYNGGQRTADITGMVTGVLEGLNEAQEYEYNRHYATEVTFQENANGDRRAVINYYQVQANDEGTVRLEQLYGIVDDEGDSIVPAVINGAGIPTPLEP